MTTAVAPAYAWRVTAAARRGSAVLEHVVYADGRAPCGVPAPIGWRDSDDNTRRCGRCEIAVDPEQFTHTAIVDQTGLTYRQLDHAVRLGYLFTIVPAEGSGSQRVFSRSELEVARRMAALVHGGMLPGPAARVARAPRAQCCGGYVIAPGVHVQFHEEDTRADHH